MNQLMLKVSALILGLMIANPAMALNFAKDVPENIKQQMIEDLKFMGEITGNGATKFHKEIFGQVDGATYKTFFETRIFDVGMNACGGGMAVACVMPFQNPNKMWLTKNFVQFSHPQVARSMVVYHESRHSESKNGNWMHDNCPRPFLDENGKEKKSIWTGATLAGEAACDSTYKGSYGSSTIMLKNISKFCTNCSDKVRMDADIYAMDQLGRIDVASVKDAMLADFNAAK